MLDDFCLTVSHFLEAFDTEPADAAWIRDEIA